MSVSLNDHLHASEAPKRILSLDGGGVKGILTLGMLEVLEAELRKRSGDKELVLSDYFDLIGGTSTGAIIATGLGLGLNVAELIKLYASLGPKVFGKTKGDGYLMGSKYDSKALKKALWPVLDKKTLGTRQLKTGLTLHAKRIDTGSAWVLSNNPRAPYFDPPEFDPGEVPNKDFRLLDLVMASAAAPTFFDEVKIPMKYNARDKPIEHAYFVDGAVGGFNNPSVQLLMTALVPAYGFGWKSGDQNLMMASFGTGSRRPTYDGKQFAKMWPGLRGVNALRSMVYDTQIQAVMLMQAVSESSRPWHINSEVGDMSGVCIAPHAMLNFQRIDVELESKPKKPKRGEKLARTSIEKLLDRELDHSVLESVDQLANGHPENMALLLEIGRNAAPAYIGDDWPSPHFDPAGWSVKQRPAD